MHNYEMPILVILGLTPALVICVVGGILLALDIFAKDQRARGFPPMTDARRQNPV